MLRMAMAELESAASWYDDELADLIPELLTVSRALVFGYVTAATNSARASGWNRNSRTIGSGRRRFELRLLPTTR
jgi:hypothetical protein